MSNAVSGSQQSWVERTLRDAGAASRMVQLNFDHDWPPASAVGGPAPVLGAVTLGSHDDGIGNGIENSGPARGLRRTVEAPNLLRDASGLMDVTTKRVHALARTGKAP